MKRAWSVDSVFGPALRNLIIVLALLAVCTAAVAFFPSAANPVAPRCSTRI